MQSCWHNLPRFVGPDGVHDQLPGAEYAARDVEVLPDGLAMDLAPAYGPVPGLHYYRRTARLTAQGLTLTDETNYTGTVQLSLMSQEPPTVDGLALQFGSLARAQLTGAVRQITTETLSITDSRLRLAWPDTLYRTVVRFTGRLQIRLG